MKTCKTNLLAIFILVHLLTSTHHLVSQVTAGSIPPGTSIVYDVADLKLADQLRDTSSYQDIDGNGTYDIRFYLQNGAPIIDDPHLAKIYILNDSFTFCKYTFFGITALYDFGDMICNSGSEVWEHDNEYTVGCNGGFECSFPLYVVADKYIGYRKNSTQEIGWMKISYDLWSGVTPDSVSFKVSEVLVPYIQTGIQTEIDAMDVQLVPNPTSDGRCLIHSSEPISSMAVYDALGQLILTYPTDSNEITLPDLRGLYFVWVQYKEGGAAMRKVIRL